MYCYLFVVRSLTCLNEAELYREGRERGELKVSVNENFSTLLDFVIFFGFLT